MVKTIPIVTSSKSYNVYVGRDAIGALKEYMKNKTVSKWLLIVDEQVAAFHPQTIQQLLSSHEQAIMYKAPAGEKSKSLQEYEKCISFALKHGVDRKSEIIAVGGGATGDLAGFVAATYMRGISFVQVPTTLLAHDSSVGGKVGINHIFGKNMIGSFYQPEAVFYDLSFLSTLPMHEWRSGFAEVVKHALIADPMFFEFLVENVKSLHNLGDKVLVHLISSGIRIKGTIVQEDEKEQGVRAFLNFGHTLGHAIESAYGYGNITHGEAVMMGMVYALLLSEKMNKLNFPFKPFLSWIHTLGYRLSLDRNLTFSDVWERMKRDKKASRQTPVFVLLRDIGQPMMKSVDKRILEETFDQFIRLGEEMK
jgi:3-dehydroquinate synthase